MGHYKLAEMEKVCQGLKNDVGAVGKVSQEIDEMSNVIQQRDQEITGWKLKLKEVNGQA